MNSKIILSMTTVLALASIAMIPSASAGALDCTGSAIQRAVCAVNETLDNITGVAQPLVDFANAEAAWAVGVANGVVVFVGQQVAAACNHVAGACSIAGNYVAPLLA